MLLFIFESIGTSELILVGIVALIFLGPRRLPEMAKKFGKIMAEFRGTANEFKETWKREVDFEEEARALDLKNLESEVQERKPKLPAATRDESIEKPVIREVDASAFEDLEAAPQTSDKSRDVGEISDDKKNWL